MAILITPFVILLLHKCTCTSPPFSFPFVLSSIHSFTNKSKQISIKRSIHSFIHSFIHLFIHSFIHLHPSFNHPSVITTQRTGCCCGTAHASPTTCPSSPAASPSPRGTPRSPEPCSGRGVGMDFVGCDVMDFVGCEYDADELC